MANLVTEHDILTVLERGCWHVQLNGICSSCREDVRRWVLTRTGFPLTAEPVIHEECQCTHCCQKRVGKRKKDALGNEYIYLRGADQ